MPAELLDLDEEDDELRGGGGELGPLLVGESRVLGEGVDFGFVNPPLKERDEEEPVRPVRPVETVVCGLKRLELPALLPEPRLLLEDPARDPLGRVEEE